MAETKIIQGDITRLAVDAVVNAANTSLLGGGGVDGAIHRAGGKQVLEECRKIIARQGKCNTGQAVFTTAGNMPARIIIHTVGPVWKGGKSGEAGKLADCYRNSLRLASELGCKTIAFPNISTGVYGYPRKDAAAIALKTVTETVDDTGITEVIFVCFDSENFRLMTELIG